MLKLLPKHMKQISKCHAFQVYVVIKNVHTLDDGWCLCICARACVCVCVWVVSLAALRVRFPVSSGGLYVSMSDTTEAEPLGRKWYAFLTAGRNWYVPNKSFLQQVDQNFVVMHCHCSNDITCKYFVYFYYTLLYQMRKFRSFV